MAAVNRGILRTAEAMTALIRQNRMIRTVIQTMILIQMIQILHQYRLHQ